ncbi:mCG1050923 [Mus musculus]|nr:mCG1050923 [Mus musculus]
MTELNYYRGRYEELQLASMGHSVSPGTCYGQKMTLDR